MLSAIRAAAGRLWHRLMVRIGGVPPPRPPMGQGAQAVEQWAGREVGEHGAEGGASYFQRQLNETSRAQGRGNPSDWLPGRSTLIGIGIGVGIALLAPGAGLAATFIGGEVITRAVNGAVGVIVGPEDSADPTASPEPAGVTGQVGDDEPSVQSDQTEEPSVVYATSKPSLQGHDDNVHTGSESSTNTQTESNSGTSGDPHEDPHGD